MYLCDFRQQPGETECWQAIWSQGLACKACYVECYRRGWPKRRVDADNRARVKRKRNDIGKVAENS